MGIFSWVDKMFGDRGGLGGIAELPESPALVARHARPFEQIEWVHVVSSNVHAIRYDEEYRKLQIAFLNGSEYEYDDVPPSVWDEFLHYPSKGKFVWAAIRGPWDANFTYRRLK